MQPGCLQVQHVICGGFLVWRINKTFIYSNRNIRHLVLLCLKPLFVVIVFTWGEADYSFIMGLKGVLQIKMYA